MTTVNDKEDFGYFKFDDALGKYDGYEGNGLSLVIQTLEESFGIEVSVVDSASKIRGALFIERKEINKLIRALQSCKDELDERMFNSLPVNPVIKDFEWWYSECVRYCAVNHVGPDDYVWDLKNPGQFREYFINDISPEDAVNAHFSTRN